MSTGCILVKKRVRNIKATALKDSPAFQAETKKDNKGVTEPMKAQTYQTPKNLGVYSHYHGHPGNSNFGSTNNIIAHITMISLI